MNTDRMFEFQYQSYIRKNLNPYYNNKVYDKLTNEQTEQKASHEETLEIKDGKNLIPDKGSKLFFRIL